MKCDDCINLLETYLDGEATERESDQIQTHLATCSMCANQLETLTAESEMFTRYDREMEISPALWNGVAARIALEDRQAESKSKTGLGEWIAGLFAMPAFRFAMPAMALVLIALLVGLAYWRTRPQAPAHGENIARAGNPKPINPTGSNSGVQQNDNPVPAPTFDSTGADEGHGPKIIAVNFPPRSRAMNIGRPTDQSDVLPDTENNNGGTMEERDTASHLEQAQNLLLSFRNIKYSDTDEEVDVSYEKSESRRLLSENIMLRREAESSGKFPAKSMLGSLEPFLIDIANLPDKARPADVRQITDRVQRTEIVAELRSY
ncbi:MAG TPA: zf-HC2 domain-containing protein [Pyrinomonadaceae bacterium]|nr:zf-HC2 domain-containing protein [Pyrinomonadaceae bacterium]